MAEGLDNAALVSYRPAVRALIAHVLGVGLSHADVEDCTSEALRRALEGHTRLQPGAAMRPWLLGIARHVALDARRARVRALRRDASAEPSKDDRAAIDQVETELPDPHEQAVLAERTARVQQAFGLLPTAQRQALSLHAEGLGYREISAELNVPIGTVCTWIARGRQALARSLGETEANQVETAPTRTSREANT
jgi:RNA polymerase sigma-70 factor (ECF subfamily)